MNNKQCSTNILYDVDLTHLNTLQIRSRAKQLVVLSNINRMGDDLNAVGLTSQQTHLDPYLILGEGSNTFFANEYYSGSVLLVQWKGIQRLERRETDVVWRVAAGESWHQLVMTSLAVGLSGLENLALIPGTVGAAPVQNIGAYGVELADCLVRVGVFDLRDHSYKILTKSACQLDYRHSLFKTELGAMYIIVFVDIKLSTSFSPQLTYEPLRHELNSSDNNEDDLTAKRVAQAVMRIRQKKLPDPRVIPNLGSFFKNPIVSVERYRALKKAFPELVAFPIGEVVQSMPKHYKLAAGWLLEHCGFKGYRSGAVAMHAQQALVLINCANIEAGEYLSGQAALQWVAKMQAAVEERFGVVLSIEPRVVE